MKLLTIDIGGSGIKYGLSEDILQISRKGSTVVSMNSFEDFLKTISDLYDQYKDDVEGIAIAMPGFIDIEKGYCYGSSVMRYRFDKELAKILSEKCGCQVTLENDGKAAAKAEHSYGALKGCSNAAVFLIGTGIGGGLIINGELLRGTRFASGEFSFINTKADNYEDPANILGNRCSTSFLLRNYKERTGSAEMIDGYEFFSRLPDDKIAEEILDEMCENIALQICNLFWLLDLEKVAIGGGISAQPVVTDKIREKFAEVKQKTMAGRPRVDVSVDIVPCRFGNDANLIGAVMTYHELLNK
jgi:predicted NBD/HSP70 family sugar kinase